MVVGAFFLSESIRWYCHQQFQQREGCIRRRVTTDTNKQKEWILDTLGSPKVLTNQETEGTQ
jgi:hypothetical protein